MPPSPPPINSTILLIGSSTPDFGGPAACKHLSLCTAWSRELHASVLILVTCKQWTCRWCGEQKARQLASRTAEAKPTKLITLTVNPALHESPRAAYDATRRAIGTLSRSIRNRFGEWEYLRVLELTKKGWPHYHFVARCPYIPQSWLSNEWDRLTGAPIVDLRKIKKNQQAYWYVMKYLGKQRYISWTKRRATLSKHFAPPPQRKSVDSLLLEDIRRCSGRPEQWLRYNCSGQRFRRLSPLLYVSDPAGAPTDPSAPAVGSSSPDGTAPPPYLA